MPQEAPLRLGTMGTLRDTLQKTGQHGSSKRQEGELKDGENFFKSSLVVKIIKLSHVKMECAQRIVYIIVFSFLTGERHLILGTAKKGILTLKYGAKDMLLRKRGSSFFFFL